MEDLSVTTAAKTRTKTAIASGVNLMIIYSASLQVRLIESKHYSLQIHLCLLIQVLTQYDDPFLHFFRNC